MDLSIFGVVEPDSISVSAQGMAAQRIRMNVLANNLANAQTTRDANGDFKPYLRREAIFQAAEVNPNMPDEEGVSIHKILPSKNPFATIHDPDHPEADDKGYRQVPKISIHREMVRMIEASAAYDANLTAMKLRNGAVGKTREILA